MPRVSFTLYSLQTGAPLAGLAPTFAVFKRVNEDGSTFNLIGSVPVISDAGDGVYYFDAAPALFTINSQIRYVVAYTQLDANSEPVTQYADGEIDSPIVSTAPEDDDDATGGALWTQSDINSLKLAVASGIMTVTYSGPPQRTITYQSLSAMRALLAEMVAQVNASTRRGVRLAATKKGLG